VKPYIGHFDANRRGIMPQAWVSGFVGTFGAQTERLDQAVCADCYIGRVCSQPPRSQNAAALQASQTRRDNRASIWTSCWSCVDRCASSNASEATCECASAVRANVTFGSKRPPQTCPQSRTPRLEAQYVPRPVREREIGGPGAAVNGPSTVIAANVKAQRTSPTDAMVQAEYKCQSASQ
jgi:hypothetical protein